MPTNDLLIVGLGELVWDHLPGATLPGGAPANFAFHVAQFGTTAKVVSAVGRDEAGDRMLAWLDGIGLAVDFVHRNDQPTGSVDVRFGADGQPQYVIHENSAWDSLGWPPSLADLAGQADCVCVGSLAQRSAGSRSTIQRFLAASRPQCLRVFDVNLRPPHFSVDVLVETLKHADVLKLNADEWPVIARVMGVREEWSVGLPELRRTAALRAIVMTRGEAASVIVDRDGIHESPAAPVIVADTVGAGDAFTATFVVGLLRGLPIEKIQRDAAAVAGFVCTQAGATPTLPTEMKERLRPPADVVRP